ncbi:MAG: hypothetical protein IIW99_05295 [Treponema sp.]|nr:hypothetical protein [Treponema sp.]
MQQFDAGCDENSLENAIKTAEIIIGQPPLKHLLPAETKCPELRFIQMTWAGTDQYTQSSIPFPKDRIALANASGRCCCVCIPNSSQTAGFMDFLRLKMMKKNSIIVNVGRGNFIDCAALNEELNNGHL